MQKYAITAVILALGLVASSMLLSNFFVRIRTEKNIRVKGYAEVEVVSDIGRLNLSVEAKEATLELAYRDLENAMTKVLDTLANHEDIDLVTTTPDISEIMAIDEKGNTTNRVEFFELTQTIQVTSKQVDVIEGLPEELGRFIREGMMVNLYVPSYFLSDLDQYKKALIEEATVNGHKRAEIMAQSSGGEVGALVSAQQGVFQITEPHSTETSGYGVYDTTSIKKVIKSVVTLEYSIR